MKLVIWMSCIVLAGWALGTLTQYDPVVATTGILAVGGLILTRDVQ